MEDNVEEPTVENEECSSFLEVELEALKSIYINETVIQKHESVTAVSIDLHPATADNLNEQYVKMTLILNVQEEYPQIIPEIDIRNPRGLSDEKLNSIIEDLIDIAESKKGSSMLFEIIEAAKDHLTEENRPCEECAICLYGFHEEDVFTKTECYHYFHSHCLARYARNFSLSEEESTSEEENAKNQLLCPVCRFPIHFDESEEEYPLPISGDEEFELTESILELQKKMSELYSKQVEKGGIIDVEAEKNKFLLEIAHVPSDLEITQAAKLEDSDLKTVDAVDMKSSPTHISPGGKERKEHSQFRANKDKDLEKSLKSSSENTKSSKSGEDKRPFKELRGERRDKNYTRERNERYNSARGGNRYGNHYANDRNGYQKSNRYNDRRNNWYDRESQNDRYENDRRSDRYRGDRKTERYGPDRYNNDTRNDRYRNDRYNGDTRNDRYGGDRRYDRRGDKYDQRYGRYDDRHHNRYEKENYQDDFKNGSFHRRRNQGHFVQGDDTNHSSNDKADNPLSPNVENPDSFGTQKPDGDRSKTSDNYEIDKETDWGNVSADKNDKPWDLDNEQQDYDKDKLEEFKNDEKSFKPNERNYQPRNRFNERQDRRSNGNFNDGRYNNRKENRYDSNRSNYRQNGSRTEFQDYERKNNRYSRGRGNRYQQNDRNERNVKSEEKETKSESYVSAEEDICISPEIDQDENVANSEGVCDSESPPFVKSSSETQVNNSARDEESAVANNAQVSEASNHRKDSFSNRNYSTNRTNKENYKKWNYGQNTNYPRGKKFNSSGAYQKSSGFHSHSKHSESPNSENYNPDFEDVNSAKADDVAKESTSHSEVSGSRNIKNNGADANDSQSFRKNYRRTNSSNNKRGPYRSYADESSRCDEEFQPELHSSNNQKDSPKYTPRTSNRRYPQRRYKEDNYDKSSNVQNTSASEAINDPKKKESSVHKSHVEESPHQAASKASDVKNSVPTSNFLPPLSSVPPPPGFQNPSRKIVYGLAAANPPPGFNRS